MQNNKNEVWAFFSSVKLALFTFFVLAVTSIIGTVIPQGKEMQFYVDSFGAGTAKLFKCSTCLICTIPGGLFPCWLSSVLT